MSAATSRTAPPAITAAPCARCPFRADVPIYLRRSRREEIARALRDDSTFWCHSTVDYDAGEDEDDEANVYGSSMCAGAAKALLLDGGSTNLMRVAERLGEVDLTALAERGAAVWSLSDWTRLAEHSTADDPEFEIEDPADADVEPCFYVGPTCDAPAGYLSPSGSIEYGTESADLTCPDCGEPICSSCAVDEDGTCPYCDESDDG